MRPCIYLLLPLLLSGCSAKQRVDTSGISAEQALPIVLASLDSGALLAEAGVSLAVSNEDYAGCLVSAGLASAMATSAEGVRGNLGGSLLPGVSVDASSCMSLAEASESTEVHEAIEPLVLSGLSAVKTMLAIYSNSMECEALGWLNASLTYAGHVTSAVLAEVSEPDGVIELSSVDVDLSGCAPEVEEVNDEESIQEEEEAAEAEPEEEAEAAPEAPAEEQPNE